MHRPHGNANTTNSGPTSPNGTGAVVALLEGIIAREEFHIVLQPIQCLRSDVVVGMEALCRFDGEPYRPPNVWFDDAERVGFGIELEIAVFEKALRLLPRLSEDVYMSLNASPAAIVSGRIREALASARCEQVVLELTEHTVCGDRPKLLEELGRIRSTATRLALDDLGAGFSGLQQLVDLNPDVLKLDISLTASIDTDPIRRSLVTAMVGFARDTNAQVVAEGIEQGSQLACLKELGVDCGQGFFIGRPARMEDLLPLQPPSAPGGTRRTGYATTANDNLSSIRTGMDTDEATALLRTTLDHMDQGILVVDGNLDVPILSPRAAELIDLPAAFAANPPSFRDILAHQVKVGAITQDYMESSINAVIIDGHALKEAHTYTRKTKNGRWLDVRTTPLPSGGFVRTFTDQTTRHRIDDMRKQSDDAYAALFENAAVGIYRFNAQRKPVRLNPMLVEMHGYSCEADMLKELENDLSDDGVYVEPGRRDEFHKRLLRDNRVTDFVSEIFCHLTRKRIWVSESAWMIFDSAGKPAGYEGMVLDVSDRKRSVDLIQHAANHDSLTQLPNRSKFNRSLRKWMGKGEPFILMYLDLDQFKPVNDQYGHAVGDGVLFAVSRRLERVFETQSRIYRIGGDEFAALLADEDAQDIDGVQKRIFETLEQPFEIDGQFLTIGISIGHAKWHIDGYDVPQLLQTADAALYANKATKRRGAVLPGLRV